MRIKILVIFLHITFTFSCSLFSQPWVIQNSNTSVGLTAVFFVNSNTGFIGGINGAFFKTTNGGTNWNTIDVGSPNITRIFYTSLNDGYFIKEENSSVSKTTNGGLNWIGYGSGSSTLYGLYFPSASTGYAAGNSNTLVKTTNAGLNWFTLNSGLTTTYNFSSLFFLTNEIGYASANGASVTSKILLTTNGGINWNIIYDGNTYINNLVFVDFVIGYAAGSNNNSAAIMRTSSGGSNWSNMTLPITETINGIYAPSTNVAIAVANNGKIIGTSNGATWNIQSSLVTPSDHLYSVFFVDNYTGWTTGSSGIIRKTITGGGLFTGLNSISNEIPSSYKLMQNFPNPFNPSTIIAFDIPQQTSVKIVVYDILGRETMKLVNEELRAGSYKVDLDGSSLTSGIYYYQIQTGDYSETKKMILLK